MKGSIDSATSVVPSTKQVKSGRRYLLLVALQTIGALIIFGHALPWYRELLADPTTYSPREDTWIWSISAIALVQVGYWVRYLVRPPLFRFRNVVLGHLVLFTSRMSFILATTLFSFVFFAQKISSQMPLGRYLLMPAGLFSLFCYMQELQRLGNCLCRPEAREPKND